MNRKDIIKYSAKQYAKGLVTAQNGLETLISSNLECLIAYVYEDAFKAGESFALFGDDTITGGLTSECDGNREEKLNKKIE